MNRNIRGLILCAALLEAGCAGLVQKGGEVLEGTAFAEKAAAAYRSGGTGSGRGEAVVELRELTSKSGESSVEITSGAWPGFALRGGAPGPDGGFELTEARILSSHARGWNEFRLGLLGSAFFAARDSGGALRITGEVERVQISSGKIRLKSSRLTGDAALAPLRSRRERILALTEWMKERRAASRETAFAAQKDFEDYWKPVLFPEPVSKKKRPPDYTEENAEWGRADGVKWNRSYTRRLLPEGFWEYRNSGEMLRDWEEALPWIYMEYSWETIIGSLDGIVLQKVR